MISFLKTLLKYVGLLLLIIILALGGFIAYITFTDYQPDKIEIIVDNESFDSFTLSQDTFSLMNWNIGYGGLGKEMDFFYDGGEGVRPSKQLSEKYLSEILSFIKDNDTVDFWMFQEVDIDAKRSYHINQLDKIVAAKEGSHGVFAKNYMCPFVPIPLFDPMGSVEAGLMTFSSFPPMLAVRHAYPLIASWPDKLFLLDRCFLLNRYPLENGKDLVVINTHNSAYVYDSILRVQELQIMKEVMLEEYKLGNYVITGGDWNQNPPNYLPKGDYNGHNFESSIVKMNKEFMPIGWMWAFDNSAPSNRSNDKPFVLGENNTTCLDYYLVSPNIELLDVEVIDLQFEDSDHNPIYLKVNLN